MRQILIIAAVGFIVYLAGVFCFVSFDLNKWHGEGRALVASFMVISMFFALVVTEQER